jgi:hypothetical protein
MGEGLPTACSKQLLEGITARQRVAPLARLRTLDRSGSGGETERNPPMRLN